MLRYLSMSGGETPIAAAGVEPIRPAIERAFASGKPACVNVIMDQEPPGIMGGYEFM
jgi:thiamine pyrophosphate-dependent acetolactate synthase large subunit-like protein